MVRWQHREGVEESLELQRRVEGMRKKSGLLFLEESKSEVLHSP